MSAVAELPAQPSLRRIARFGVRPDRDLGQHFLIDDNILGVIERAADLARSDVVLEIGGGVGVLSEFLAERVAHVHVIEVDERLREALADATDAHPNATVHWGDAMRIDLRALRPRPLKVVANLPYGIAAAVLLRTIDQLPGVGSWAAMVQREVGERLAASPGSRTYGASSVLAQLACEVELLRTLPRRVFYPVPNVDSVLMRLRRRATPGETQEPSPELRALIAGAFAHRRKTLVSSLTLAGAGGGHSRERVREALERVGQRPDVRAERLSPDDFRALSRALRL
jgi:16S rRNA (adenine1518-N6/adenine1519-N6)-dimethyltransferase